MIEQHIDTSVSALLEQWRRQLAAVLAAAPDADKFDYEAIVDGKPMRFCGCRIISVEPDPYSERDEAWRGEFAS